MAGIVNPITIKPNPTHAQSPEENPSCLNGWKEIASYFGRSVRTVQRWESLEGLPVRRHRHRVGESIYANRDELEEWRMTRSQIVRSRRKTRNLQNQWITTPADRDLLIHALLNALLTLDRTTYKSAEKVFTPEGPESVKELFVEGGLRPAEVECRHRPGMSVPTNSRLED